MLLGEFLSILSMDQLQERSLNRTTSSQTLFLEAVSDGTEAKVCSHLRGDLPKLVPADPRVPLHLNNQTVVQSDSSGPFTTTIPRLLGL